MKEETTKKFKEDSRKDFSYQINETGEYRDTWRIFRIMSEFVEGYQFLSKLEREVTILGSARFKEDSKYYKIAEELGGLLGKNDYAVITGGGPGIMEAANKGAFDVGGESIGLNIQLPFEQRVNPYVKKSTAFYYFFTRKVMLTSPAHAFVYFPGGFGTLDEFFEVVNHIEIGKMCPLPIILVGKEYWQPILDFLKQKVCELSTNHLKEMEKWRLVDSAEEAFSIIKKEELTDRACDLSVMNFHSSSKNVDWKIFKIMAELVEGFEFLTGLVEDVTVLGTRSVEPDNLYYDAAYNIGKKLAEKGYTVVTGGSAGVAEAANKGCLEVGGESMSVGMEVYNKVQVNKYAKKSITFKFPFTRKFIITAPSKAFIFFPGGFGTLHHLFEVLTLIQTKKMQEIPIVLFDSKYWGPLDKYIKEELSQKFQTISTENVDLYKIVDTEEEIMEIINKFRNKT